jgi:hypothetical protein
LVRNTSLSMWTLTRMSLNPLYLSCFCCITFVFCCPSHWIYWIFLQQNWICLWTKSIMVYHWACLWTQSIRVYHWTCLRTPIKQGLSLDLLVNSNQLGFMIKLA